MIARHWESSKENAESKDCKIVKCLLCPNFCVIGEGGKGACGVRVNVDGTLVATSYGKVTSIALDPIEKKPLYEFRPGAAILSVGSYGCNFHCPFCQNHTISLEYENTQAESVMPEEITQLAKKTVPSGNIGVAYTYNEPLINFEYVYDCCKMIKQAGLVNVLVTNGHINPEPLREILPLIDAMNIDIKGGAEGTYKTIGGKSDAVKEVVELSHKTCHIEITTLVIPDENEDDVEDIARFIASIDKKIPYHLSRFFPRHKYKDRPPTPLDTMHRTREVATRHLDNVYLGNV